MTRKEIKKAQNLSFGGRELNERGKSRSVSGMWVCLSVFVVIFFVLNFRFLGFYTVFGLMYSVIKWLVSGQKFMSAYFMKLLTVTERKSDFLKFWTEINTDTGHVPNNINWTEI